MNGVKFGKDMELPEFFGGKEKVVLFFWAQASSGGN